MIDQNKHKRQYQTVCFIYNNGILTKLIEYCLSILNIIKQLYFPMFVLIPMICKIQLHILEYRLDTSKYYLIIPEPCVVL